jgi:hypothetical protein
MRAAHGWSDINYHPDEKPDMWQKHHSFRLNPPAITATLRLTLSMGAILKGQWQ